MDVTMDRVRIVRNSIHREWQRLKTTRESLPNAKPSWHEYIKERMNGLMFSLDNIYDEFPELERLKEDQQPRCPFCNEEMDTRRLAVHMAEHMEKGDRL
jgi:hypothetical protein